MIDQQLERGKTEEPQQEGQLLDLSSKALLAAVQRIEAEAYPPEWREYDNKKNLKEDLSMPGADELSFVKMRDDGEVVGYCVAYEEESDVDDRTVIYVADVAVSVEEQNGVNGARIMLDLLERARAYDPELLVEFDARKDTTYKALMRPGTQELLRKAGYVVHDYGLSQTFDDGGFTHLLRLEPVA